MNVNTLEQQLSINDPSVRRARFAKLKDTGRLEHLQAELLAYFERVVAERSRIVPRGPDVFSMRMLPQLPGSESREPLVYRVYVPSQRAVWLKMGLLETDRDGGVDYSPRMLDKLDAFLTSSPLALSGPFESRLPEGEHQLSIAVEKLSKGVVSVLIKLDDQTLLATRYDEPTMVGTGSGWRSTSQQADMGPKFALPWLAEFSFNLQATTGASERKHRLKFWLSDESSEFAEFPQP